MKNKKIAIVIPSAKPYNIFLRVVLENVRASISKNPYPYQFIVSAPHDIPELANQEDVVLLRDTVNNGENIAINQCFDYALKNGFDYLLLTCDDHVIHPDSKPLFDVIDFLQSDTFKDRKLKMCAVATHYHPTCYVDQGMPTPGGGRNPANFIKNFIPYTPILRFFVTDRDTLIKNFNGSFGHPDVLSGHGDVLVGYYSAINGETPIELQEVKWDYINPSDLNNYDGVYKNSSKFINLRTQSCNVAAQLMNKYIPGTLGFKNK